MDAVSQLADIKLSDGGQHHSEECQQSVNKYFWLLYQGELLDELADIAEIRQNCNQFIYFAVNK
jgi:hypothetical protein